MFSFEGSPYTGPIIFNTNYITYEIIDESWTHFCDFLGNNLGHNGL